MSLERDYTNCGDCFNLFQKAPKLCKDCGYMRPYIQKIIKTLQED